MKEALITLLISKVLISAISVITTASMLIVANRLQRPSSTRQSPDVAESCWEFSGLYFHLDEVIVTSDSRGKETPLKVLNRAQKQSAMCANVSKFPPDTRCDQVCFGFFLCFDCFCSWLQVLASLPNNTAKDKQQICHFGGRPWRRGIFLLADTDDESAPL